jgi:hypothetical protein
MREHDPTPSILDQLDCNAERLEGQPGWKELTEEQKAEAGRAFETLSSTSGPSVRRSAHGTRRSRAGGGQVARRDRRDGKEGGVKEKRSGPFGGGGGNGPDLCDAAQCGTLNDWIQTRFESSSNYALVLVERRFPATAA